VDGKEIEDLLRRLVVGASRDPVLDRSGRCSEGIMDRSGTRNMQGIKKREKPWRTGRTLYPSK